MLTIAGTVRLIADLHLQPDHDTVTRRFSSFLVDCAQQRIAALFILGDLFEYWIGDDALVDPFNAMLGEHMRRLADSGTALYFLHGNRDFLVGAHMAQACGLQLLPECVKVSAGGTATLLLHGDTLCTDDTDYQAFRAMVRSPAWRSAFLARPLAERLAEVAKLREGSRQAMRGKNAQIMDANREAIIAALQSSGCQRLIHGHTHRPGMDAYRIEQAGQMVDAERWVLSDWTDTRGDALEISASGIRRLSLAG